MLWLWKLAPSLYFTHECLSPSMSTVHTSPVNTGLLQDCSLSQLYRHDATSLLQRLTEGHTITHAHNQPSVDLQGERAEPHCGKESETVSFLLRCAASLLTAVTALASLHLASVLNHSCLLQPSRLLCSLEELCSASCCHVMLLHIAGLLFLRLLRLLLPPCGA